MFRNVSRRSVEKFQCCICLEHVPVATRLVMKQCECNHSTCAECLKTYLRLRIEEGRVSELKCPKAGGEDGCAACASDEELKAWLTEEVFEKFQRYTRMAADPLLRACPHCAKLISPEVKEDGTVVQDMRCVDCDAHFCYYHSNAHEQGEAACIAYEREVVKKQ